VSPSGSACLVLCAYAPSFPMLAVITAVSTVPSFLSHTNSVYGALRCALILVSTTPAQKVIL